MFVYCTKISSITLFCIFLWIKDNAISKGSFVLDYIKLNFNYINLHN